MTTDYTDDTDSGKPYPCLSVKSVVKFLVCLSVWSALAAPLALHAQREKLPPDDLAFVEKTWPEAKKTGTGIRYIVLHEGKGETGKPGDLATVLYIGRLLNGTVFDQATERDHPFPPFRVGRGMVIDGWDSPRWRLRR